VWYVYIIFCIYALNTCITNKRTKQDQLLVQYHENDILMSHRHYARPNEAYLSQYVRMKKDDDKKAAGHAATKWCLHAYQQQGMYQQIWQPIQKRTRNRPQVAATKLTGSCTCRVSMCTCWAQRLLTPWRSQTPETGYPASVWPSFV